MAVYNGERYIEQQIASILSQLRDTDELVISDDNSTDGTIEKILDIKDSRIKIYRSTLNKGYTNNFYTALSNCSGDYIFFSDQDDIWESDKVNFFMEKFNLGYDAVVSDCKIIDVDEALISNSFFKQRKSKFGYLNTLFKSGYLGCCLAISKKMIDMALSERKSKILPYDLWIGLIAFRFFNTAIIYESTLLYRRHKNNTSDGGLSTSRNSLYYKLKFRLVALIKVEVRGITNAIRKNKKTKNK
ncbi:MAG: glycosyltransferase [Acholeplasma sp.]|nr:glycosyltransferase [Acholeplasma sp.]